jgi:hypothetical protein
MKKQKLIAVPDNCLHLPANRGGGWLSNSAGALNHGLGINGVLRNIADIEGRYLRPTAKDLEEYERIKERHESEVGNEEFYKEQAQNSKFPDGQWANDFDSIFSEFIRSGLWEQCKKGLVDRKDLPYEGYNYDKYIQERIEEHKLESAYYTTYENFIKFLVEKSYYFDMLRRIKFTMHDLKAFANRHGNPNLENPKDWIVNYLNLARIGSYSGVEGEGETAIINARLTPFTDFEPWLINGFHLINSNALYTYKETSDGGKYTQLHPTKEQQEQELKKKAEIEERLGRPLVVRNLFHGDEKI